MKKRRCEVMLKLVAIISLMYIAYKMYKLYKDTKKRLEDTNDNVIELKKDEDWRYEEKDSNS
jgi:competence protein ComGF